MEKSISPELTKNSTFYEKLMNLLVAGVYVYDVILGKMLYINKQYTTITGYEFSDINDMDTEEFFGLFHPDDLEPINNHIQELVSSPTNNVSTIEYRFKNSEGDWIWCYSKDGLLTVNEEEKSTMIIGSFMDITAFKANEKVTKEANEKLLIFNKKAQELSHMTSHELQEPINVIQSSIDLIKTIIPDENDTKLLTYLSFIEQSTVRMSTLLKALQRYFQLDINLKKESNDLNFIIKDIELDLKSLLQETNTSLHYEKLPSLMATELDLKIVLREIILNAIKYKKHDVSPQIYIRVDHEEGNYYKVAIQDNGIGIDPKYHATIFDVFNKVNENSIYENGIGLALCKKIIDLNNGKIWVESTLGEGSTFYFLFPYIDNSLSKLSTHSS